MSTKPTRHVGAPGECPENLAELHQIERGERRAIFRDIRANLERLEQECGVDEEFGQSYHRLYDEKGTEVWLFGVEYWGSGKINHILVNQRTFDGEFVYYNSSEYAVPKFNVLGYRHGNAILDVAEGDWTKALSVNPSFTLIQAHADTARCASYRHSQNYLLMPPAFWRPEIGEVLDAHDELVALQGLLWRLNPITQEEGVSGIPG